MKQERQPNTRTAGHLALCAVYHVSPCLKVTSIPTRASPPLLWALDWRPESVWGHLWGPCARRVSRAALILQTSNGPRAEKGLALGDRVQPKARAQSPSSTPAEEAGPHYPSLLPVSRALGRWSRGPRAAQVWPISSLESQDHL